MFKKYSESSVNVPGGLDKSSFQVIQCKRGKTQRKEVTKQTKRCFELYSQTLRLQDEKMSSYIIPLIASGCFDRTHNVTRRI